MRNFIVLTVLVLSLALFGCGAPKPVPIKETGLKPVNDLKYYNLTEKERKNFELEAAERAEKRKAASITRNKKRATPTPEKVKEEDGMGSY